MRKKLLLALLLMGNIVIAALARSPKANDSGTSATNEPNNPISGGAIVETNLSNFLHSGARGGNSKMKAGFTVGGFMNFGINTSFSVQGEMLFHHKNSDFKWDNQTGLFPYWGMEVPIYVMYHYNFSRGGRLFAGIGPYTEFGFDAVFKQNGRKSNLYEKNESSGLAPLRDSNTGFGIKIGYEFPSGLQLHATYKASVTNQLDENSSDIKMHPQTVSVGVAYRFGK